MLSFFQNEDSSLIRLNFSWLSIFIQLAGLEPNPSQTVVEIARAKYKRPTIDQLLKAMKNSTNFLVARNPMERLGIFHKNIKGSFINRQSSVKITFSNFTHSFLFSVKVPHTAFFTHHKCKSIG